MTVQWAPPRRSYHLRVFAISLALIVFCLAGFLFGVRMEAVVPATGTITARDLHEVRSLMSGLIEPGWYEAEVTRNGKPPLAVRLDGHSNRFLDRGVKLLAAPGQALSEERQKALAKGVRFHRLQ